MMISNLLVHGLLCPALSSTRKADRIFPRHLPLKARLFFGAVLFSMSLAFFQSANADDAAEQFMVQVLNEANTAMAAPTREAQLVGIEQLVDQYVDMRRSGRFTLGQYARQMSKEQATEFYPLFRRYATAIYQEVLSEYSGERLTVTGSIDRSARDIIVNSKIADARPGDRFAGLNVQWRLYKNREGTLKVVDAGADNIWLAIEQRSQFNTIIANNGGGQQGINALITQLKDRVGE